jgi:hypothetical protein
MVRYEVAGLAVVLWVLFVALTLFETDPDIRVVAVYDKSRR